MKTKAVTELCELFLDSLNEFDFFSLIAGINKVKFPRKLGFDLLFDERDLESIIRFSPDSDHRLNVIKLVFNGMSVKMDAILRNGIIDYDKFLRLHYGGTTVIINGLDNYSNSLYYWTKFLEGIFEARVQTNFYGTPENSQGFNAHTDDHDVIITQLKGAKHWTFYDFKSENQKVLGKSLPIEDVFVTENILLSESDCLYIPRGLLHSARTKNQVSWHLTTGINGYYWSDLLKDSIERAIFENNELQQLVKIHSYDTSQTEEIAKRLLDNIKSHISADESIGRYKSRFKNTGKFLNKIVLPDSDLMKQFDEHMRFRLVRNAQIEIKEGIRYLSLNLPYRRKPLLMHTRLNKAIGHIKGKGSFSPKLLSGLTDDSEKLLFTYYLWNNGFIEPIKD